MEKDDCAFGIWKKYPAIDLRTEQPAPDNKAKMKSMMLDGAEGLAKMIYMGTRKMFDIKMTVMIFSHFMNKK